MHCTGNCDNILLTAFDTFCLYHCRDDDARPRRCKCPHLCEKMRLGNHGDEDHSSTTWRMWKLGPYKEINVTGYIPPVFMNFARSWKVGEVLEKRLSEIVQSGWSGCCTGNGEKLSNSQVCCLATAVSSCCLVSFCFLCDIHFIHSVPCNTSAIKSSRNRARMNLDH